MEGSPIKTESGDPLRLYHATPKDLSVIKAGGDDPTKSGYATWLTDNPEYQPAMHNVGSRSADFREGANVMPLYSNAKRPLMLDDPITMDWARQVFADGSSDFPYLIPEKTAKAIREAGYDYIHYADPHGIKEGHEYIMLDPERQLKSAIGNQGTYDTSDPDITKAQGGIVKMAEGGTPDREFIDRMREEFSVYNKPTYGNEIPGTPTIDQQRYELTMKGRQEAENRARTTRDSLTAMDPSGTLGIVDALKTVGKAVVAPIAYVGGNAFDWLQTGKVDPAKSKARGEKLENWMTPKTQEGGEILEEIGKVGPALTGSEMGFGMHPNLWASGIGLTTPKQTAAGLRLGSERVAPFAKDVGSMASELYMSGKMPGMVAPNMYAVAPDGKPSKVLAPANEIGFYSPTEAAALNLQRKSGAGQAFLNDIMKGENVKSDEISAMGLDTFLKDKKNVTADEVRDYIAKNKIQLGEARYGKLSNRQLMDEWNRIAEQEYGKTYGELYHDEAVKVEKYAEQDTSKFSDYALPGGENYREIVLTLPPTNKYRVEPIEGTSRWKIVDENGDIQKSYYDQADADRAVASYNRQAGEYTSPHWNDPNALSHLRVSDRVTDGKKTLLVDEVQSDWHQAGREQGYKNESTEAKKAYRDYGTELKKRYMDDIRTELSQEITDPERLEKQVMNLSEGLSLGQMAKYFDEQDKYNSLYKDYNLEIGKNRQGVPDAPYKEDWYQLTLRRAIKEAIDGGYDRVALPTGARVADRFDLSKQIDRIDYNKNDDGTYSMSAVKDGQEVFAKEDLDEKELSRLVGKDVAKKIVGDEGSSAPKADRWESEDGDEPEFKSLSGLDLSVGGEGMKKYYDEIYPGSLKKFGKKYGANVGTT
jgi:hypothetical protein